MYDMTMGERIRFLRRKQGLSQEQLAEKIGVTKSTISKYELDTRYPKRNTLEVLSQILNVELYLLLTGRTRAEWDLQFEKEDKSFWDEMEGILLPGYLKNIKQLFEQLNEEGQQKAVERVEELTEIPKYKKEPPQE